MPSIAKEHIQALGVVSEGLRNYKIGLPQNN